MGGQQRQLEPAATSLGQQCADASDVQVPAFEQQQREEKRSLMARDEPENSALGSRLLLGPSQNVAFHVRIQTHLVRVSMVAVVLVHPPVVAEPNAKVG